ncbi:MAG: isopenicillin N synthase family oxygenase, partial [Chloroflexi bacterium]|nr:isopenicillin N synthase family oxygenase [Chloroflexota bacterium]
MTTTYTQLPVLDLGRLEGNPQERDAFLAELRTTAYDLGFFYVTGHGVPQALIDNTIAVAKEFFALPEAEKLAIEMVNSPHFRG